MKAKIYQIDFCPAEWNDWCVIFLFQKFVLEMKSRCGEVLAELENSKELEVRWKFPKTIILLSLKKKQSNRNDIIGKRNFISTSQIGILSDISLDGAQTVHQFSNERKTSTVLFQGNYRGGWKGNWKIQKKTIIQVVEVLWCFWSNLGSTKNF